MAAACELCGETENLVIDHIMPLSQGGSNDIDNLRTLCSSCNTKEAWKYKARPEVKRTKRGYALRDDLVKACKQIALDMDRTLYEVMEEAISEYLHRHKAE